MMGWERKQIFCAYQVINSIRSNIVVHRRFAEVLLRTRGKNNVMLPKFITLIPVRGMQSILPCPQKW